LTWPQSAIGFTYRPLTGAGS